MNPEAAEEQSLADLWKAHREALRGVRKALAKEGATIQVDIIIRDKAATERHAKRMARKKR